MIQPRVAGGSPGWQVAGVTTPLDADLLQWLSRLADADARSLADMIFNAGSVLSTLSPAAAVRADCKLYKEGERRFSVSQVEELGFTNFWKCEDALLEALEKLRQY